MQTKPGVIETDSYILRGDQGDLYDAGDPHHEESLILESLECGQPAGWVIDPLTGARVCAEEI